MLTKNNLKISLGLLLLPAILWLFFNSSINWHYHLLSTGKVVKHSHPYQQDKQTENSTSTPFQSHEHSSSEIAFIDQVSKSGATDVLNMGKLLSFLYSQEHTFSLYQIEFICGIPRSEISLRGPPSVS